MWREGPRQLDMISKGVGGEGFFTFRGIVIDEFASSRNFVLCFVDLSTRWTGAPGRKLKSFQKDSCVSAACWRRGFFFFLLFFFRSFVWLICWFMVRTIVLVLNGMIPTITLTSLGRESKQRQRWNQRKDKETLIYADRGAESGSAYRLMWKGSGKTWWHVRRMTDRGCHRELNLIELFRGLLNRLVRKTRPYTCCSG